MSVLILPDPVSLPYSPLYVTFRR